MLTDGRKVPRGSVLRADLCVIGGGAAGITIARALANTSLSVIVLESGGTEPDDPTQALTAGVVVGEPYRPPLDAARLRLVGGSTNHWAGACRPLDPVDLGPRPGRPNAAWPLSRDELEPWYVQAHEVIQIGPYEYDWRWWQAKLGLAPAVLDTETVATSVLQIAQDRNDRRRFGEMYFDELKQATNVRFCVWANVVELDSNENGSRATGAEVVTIGGNRWRVEARVFVVAVGGLDTPRLLLASRSSRPNGLGNDRDLVGRYFMEHLQSSPASLVLARPLDALSLYGYVIAPAELGRREQYINGVLRPTSAAVDRHELLASDIVVLTEGVEDGGSRSGERVIASDVSRLLERVEGSAPSVASLAVGAEQRPDPESRVRLSREKDALGVPKLELDWRVGRHDRESIVRSLMLLAAEVGRLGVGRLGFTPGGDAAAGSLRTGSSAATNVDALLDFDIWGGCHHMGTTRMHEDPRRGVVDSTCKVHDVANLYVAGCSVFPTGGSSPPTMTIVALALRLADHLQRKVLV